MAKKGIKDYIFNPEFECMTRSEMENLQSERLRKTVERVYNNCAPYRAKMDEMKLKPSDIPTGISLKVICQKIYSIKKENSV